MMTAFFPPILPEEPIGYYHDRIEAYGGIGNCRPVRAKHLGAPGRSVDLRLPRNLNCLMRVLTFAFPNMQLWDLARLHTDYPYYAASLSEPARKNLLARMCNYKSGPLRPLRALPGEDAFLARPLWCRVCQAEDEEAFGCAYIHRYSTLPCVGFCPIHGIPLIPQGTPEAGSIPTICGALANTLAFCRASSELLQSSQPAYHLLKVLSRLADAGFLTKTGRVRMQSLAEAVAVSYAEGFLQPTLTAMTRDVNGVNAWLKVAVASNCHPVHYLLLMGGIRGAVMPSAQPAAPRSVNDKCARALEDVRRGISIRSVSERIGVTDNTLLCRVRAAGIPYKARAKRLFPPEQRQILQSLARGESVADICKWNCVSVSSTYRILASSVDTQRKRRQALLTQEGKRHRSAWLRLVRFNPRASRSELRRLESATWAWLRRHDPTWLQEHEPIPISGGGPRAMSLPSNEETAEAIARLKNACFKLCGPRPLTMQRVLDAAGIPSAAHTRLLRRDSYRAALIRHVGAFCR